MGGKGQLKALLVALAIVLSVAVLAYAEVPQTINYQGYLTDANGAVDSTVQMTFRIYNDVETVKWEETHSAVTVKKGVYSVVLGSVNPLNLPFDEQYFLGVTVGENEEMMPRQPLASVPNAFRAAVSGTTETEIDPEVGTLEAGMWCTSDGTQINCIEAAPVISETDPVFSAWDKSTGISISESQISDLHHFSTGDETDPTVNALGTTDLECTEGQVPKYNGSAWICAADQGGGGADGDWTVTGSNMYSSVTGNVGIGTSNPLYSLSLYGVPRIINDSDAQATIDTVDSRPMAAGVGGGISFGGHYKTGGGTSDFLYEFANIKGVKENITDGNSAGAMVFSTRSTGTFNMPTERMRISSGGHVGIGPGIEATDNVNYITEPIGLLNLNARVDDDAGDYRNGLVFTNDIYHPDYGPWTQAAIWSEGKVGYNGELIFGTDGDNDRNLDGNHGIVERMRITKNGHVGVGTPNPSALLHVSTSIEAIRGESITTGVTGTNPLFQTEGRLADQGKGVYGKAGLGNTYAGYFEGHVKVVGMHTVDVIEVLGGGDLSERFDVKKIGRDILPEPGMLVSIDPKNPGGLAVSRKSYDRKIAGIISGANGIKPGMMMGQKGTEVDGAFPVALSGRVYCLADASNGPIEPGDLLTTSDNPGHAMKVTDHAKAQGAILGKAMNGLEEGTGMVLVLVTLQ